MNNKSLFEKIFRNSPPNVSANNRSVAIGGDNNAPINFYGIDGEQTINVIKTELSENYGKTSDLLTDKFNNLRKISDQTLISEAIDQQLDARIDEIGTLIQKRKIQTALDLFKSLFENEASKASKRILFRIKANIGICNLFLGKETEAGNLLLEAFNFAPEEPKAISNKIIGLLLLDRNTEAFEFGKKTLIQSPEDENLAGYVIQASKFERHINNPLEMISNELRDTAPVLTGYISFLIYRNNRDWWRVAADAFRKYPDDPELKIYAASAILDEIVSGLSYKKYPSLLNEQKQNLQTSVVIFQEHWNNILAGENIFTKEDASICCNLLLSYGLLENKEEVEKICNQILEKSIHNINLLERVAQLSIDYNLLDISKKTISRLSDTPARDLLEFQYNVIVGEWSKISTLSEEKIKKFPIAEQSMVLTAVTIAKLQNAADNENRAVKFDSINSIFEQVQKQQDARTYIVIANFAGKFAFNDLAAKAYKKALSLIHSDSNYSERSMVAAYAFSNHIYSDVITMLYSHVNTNCDNPDLRNLSIAFVNYTPIQEKAVDFFNQLSENLFEIDFYISVYAVFNFRYEDFVTSEKWLTKAIKFNKNDLGVLLPLIYLYSKHNEDGKALKLINSIDINSLIGQPSEKLHFVYFLKKFGKIKESLEYIYELQKNYSSNPDIAVEYVNFLFSLDNKIFPTCEFVESNCFVNLKDQFKNSSSFIISVEKSNGSDNIYALDHLFSKNAIGLKIGESFIQEGIQKKTWTVTDIKSKYHHVQHEIMNTFEQRFPNYHGIFRINIIDNDISPILDLIKKTSKSNEEMANFYISGWLPLSMFANGMGKSVISFAEYIRSLGANIKTCIGTTEERQIAINLICNRNKCQNVVLDTYTAWVVSVLDIFDILKNLFNSLFIPQSVINDILLLKNTQFPYGEEKRTIAFNNNEFIGQELTSEECGKIFDEITILENRIKQNCEILPVAAPDNIEIIRDLIDSKISLDSIFLAQKENCYLLSEDFCYRQLFLSLFDNPFSLWLQPLVNYALDNRIINNKRHSKIILQLAAYKHDHLSIAPRTLVHVLINDNTEKLIEFSTVANFIGGKNADITSHTHVVQDFLFLLWNDKETNLICDFKMKKATGILLYKFCRINGFENQWNEVYFVLTSNNNLPQKSIDYIHRWFRGHFLF